MVAYDTLTDEQRKTADLGTEKLTAAIGPYRVTRVLGKGAFGCVYEAYQPFLDRQVAIKTLLASVEMESEVEQRFMREARAIARLRHPNIVTVYEFGNFDRPGQRGSNTTYMVMEYLPGPTLQQRIASKTLSLSDIVWITEQLAQGLDYAHTEGIIHRDLKPANIIFSERNQPVIVDFGLANLMKLGASRDLSVTNLSSTTAGTPAYMAPEQVASEQISPATDQYALAIIAFEMLTGQLPFAVDNPEGVFARLTEFPLALRDVAPQYSIGAEMVLQRALSRDPDGRYPTVASFIRELGDALLPERVRESQAVVPDPGQAAILRETRNTLKVALWALVAGTVIALLYCGSVIVRGYAAGSPPFLWDGIIGPNNRLESGQRIVSGVWPGSVAERAGLQLGDIMQDDLSKDRTLQTAAFTINGHARSEYPIDWQPQLNDQISYDVLRGGTTVHISYHLERSPYLLVLMAVNLPPILLLLGGAVWVLRLGSARPNFLLIAPILLIACVTVMGAVVLRLIPGINVLAMYILLPTVIHFILIFPATGKFAEYHQSNLLRLLYVPALLGLAQFLLGGYLRIGNLDANVVVFAAYGLGILWTAYCKWGRHDIQQYPGLWFMLAALGILIATTIISTVIWGQSHTAILAIFGNGVTQLMLGYTIISVGACAGTLCVLACLWSMRAKAEDSVTARILPTQAVQY